MSPENSTRTDRHVYQTEILNNLMDQLLAADVLLGDQAALPTSSSASVTYTTLANNVFYLAGRIVDKLWQGTTVCLSWLDGRMGKVWSQPSGCSDAEQMERNQGDSWFTLNASLTSLSFCGQMQRAWWQCKTNFGIKHTFCFFMVYWLSFHTLSIIIINYYY